MRVATAGVFVAVVMSVPACAGHASRATSPSPQAAATTTPPVELTAQQDHQRLMGLLGITSLRPGPSGNPKAPNAANVDEAKATPYTTLPDPLVMKNGRKVTSASQWAKRRAEIVEDFDREIYGRTPARTPRVRWEVTGRTDELVGNVPVVTKTLVGHVDNSSYPQVSVDIQLTLTTPAKATGPVPVMLNFGFGPRPAGAPPRPPAPGPSWQEQLLAKGWGYAVFVPTSVQPDNGAGLTRGIIGLVNKGQPRKLDDWGALKAWAWGASRALDYLETDKAVDAKQVGLEGLSRYGKAAVVAMAYDPRFAIGFIGSSGAGGVKLLSPALRRAGRKRRRVGRVSLDGGQLHQVRRPADAERPAGGLRTSSSRSARRVRCSSAPARWRWKAAGWTPRACSWPASAPDRSTACWAGRIWARRSFRRRKPRSSTATSRSVSTAAATRRARTGRPS